MKGRFIGLHADFAGFLVSILCAIHCAGLPFLLSILPLAGLSFLENIWVEYGFIFLSFLIAAYALIRCYFMHHRQPLALVVVMFGFLFIGFGHTSQLEPIEMVLTSVGAVTIAIGHVINWRHVRKVVQ